MAKLQVVIASTRPGRVGLPVGKWFFERAQSHGKFDVELVDLKEVGLPLLDEPEHPRLKRYQHEHTKRWSERVASADAFAFVIPEYNYSPPPSLLNALDYLYSEWAYKPAGLVSYGGISGGVRSQQAIKLTLTTLKIVPLPEAVTIPFVAKHLGEDGSFRGEKNHDDAATAVLDELHRWTEALRTLRA